MGTRQLRLAAIAVSLDLLAAGCTSELAHDLEEPEANRLVSALEESGIGASTSSEGQLDDRSWVVSVASADLTSARAVLQDRDLPDQPEPGLAEVFDRGGLLPTPTEEQALLIRAVQGELVKSLESVDGVLAARVHIALSSSQGSLIPLEGPEPLTTASVLMRYSSRAKAPPLTDSQVKALVSGAVQGLDPERIAVVSVAVPPSRSVQRRQLVAIGPFAVSPASATSLRASIGVSAVVIGLLGLTLAALVLRIRGLRRRLIAAEAAVDQARGSAGAAGAHSSGDRTKG